MWSARQEPGEDNSKIHGLKKRKSTWLRHHWLFETEEWQNKEPGMTKQTMSLDGSRRSHRLIGQRRMRCHIPDSAGEWGKPILGIIVISVLTDLIEKKLINSTVDRWYRMPSQRRECKYCKKWVSRQHETLHIVWWECFQCMKTFNSPSGARYHKETIQFVINTIWRQKHSGADGSGPKETPESSHQLPFHCRYKCWNIICTRNQLAVSMLIGRMWIKDNLYTYSCIIISLMQMCQ